MSSVSAGTSSPFADVLRNFRQEQKGTPVSNCNTEGVAYVKSLELEASYHLR